MIIWSARIQLPCCQYWLQERTAASKAPICVGQATLCPDQSRKGWCIQLHSHPQLTYLVRHLDVLKLHLEPGLKILH